VVWRGEKEATNRKGKENRQGGVFSKINKKQVVSGYIFFEGKN
jgi:hypothetical protein